MLYDEVCWLCSTLLHTGNQQIEHDTHAPSPVLKARMQNKHKNYQPAETVREGPRLRHVISFIETEAQIHPGNKRVKVANSLLNCGVCVIYGAEVAVEGGRVP